MAFEYRDDGRVTGWVDLAAARAWASVAARELLAAQSSGSDARWLAGVTALRNAALALNLPPREVGIYPAINPSGGEEGYSSPATIDKPLSSIPEASRPGQFPARIAAAQAIAAAPWAFYVATRDAIDRRNTNLAAQWGLTGAAAAGFASAPETALRAMGDDWNARNDAAAQADWSAKLDRASQYAAASVAGVVIVPVIQALKALGTVFTWAGGAPPSPPYRRTVTGGVTPREEDRPSQVVPDVAGADVPSVPGGDLPPAFLPNAVFNARNVAAALMRPAALVEKSTNSKAGSSVEVQGKPDSYLVPGLAIAGVVVILGGIAYFLRNE